MRSSPESESGKTPEAVHLRILKDLLTRQNTVWTWTDSDYNKLINNTALLLSRRGTAFSVTSKEFLKYIRLYLTGRLNPQDIVVNRWVAQINAVLPTDVEVLDASVKLLQRLLAQMISPDRRLPDTSTNSPAPTPSPRKTQSSATSAETYTQGYHFSGQLTPRSLGASYFLDHIGQNASQNLPLFKYLLQNAAEGGSGTIESETRELYAKGEYDLLVKLIKGSQIYQLVWLSEDNEELGTILSDYYKDSEGVPIFKINMNGNDFELPEEDFEALVIFSETKTSQSYGLTHPDQKIVAANDSLLEFHTELANEIQPLRDYTRNLMMMITTFPENLDDFTEIQYGVLDVILQTLDESAQIAITRRYAARHQEKSQPEAIQNDQYGQTWIALLVSELSEIITPTLLNTIIDDFENLNIINTYITTKPGRYAGQKTLVQITTSASLKKPIGSIGIKWEHEWQSGIIEGFARRTKNSVILEFGSMKTREGVKKSQSSDKQPSRIIKTIPSALARSYEVQNLKTVGNADTLNQLLHDLIKQQEKDHRQNQQNSQSNTERSEPHQSPTSDKEPDVNNVDELEDIENTENTEDTIIEEVYYDLDTGELVIGSYDSYRERIESQLIWLRTRIETITDLDTIYTSSRFEEYATRANELNENILELLTTNHEVPANLKSQYDICLSICTLLLVELRNIIARLIGDGDGIPQTSFPLLATYTQLRSLFSYIMMLPGYPAAFSILFPALTSPTFQQNINQLENTLLPSDHPELEELRIGTAKLRLAEAMTEPNYPSISQSQLILWRNSLAPLPLAELESEPTTSEEVRPARETVSDENAIESPRISPLILNLKAANVSGRERIPYFTIAESITEQTRSRITTAINNNGLITKLLFGNSKGRISPHKIGEYLKLTPYDKSAGAIEQLRTSGDNLFQMIEQEGFALPELDGLDGMAAIRSHVNQISQIRTQFILDIANTLFSNKWIKIIYMLDNPQIVHNSTDTVFSGAIVSELSRRASEFVNSLLEIFAPEIDRHLREQQQAEQRRTAEIAANIQGFENALTVLLPNFEPAFMQTAHDFLRQHLENYTDRGTLSTVFRYLSIKLLPNTVYPIDSSFNVANCPEYLQPQLEKYNKLRTLHNRILNILKKLQNDGKKIVEVLKDSQGNDVYIPSISLNEFNSDIDRVTNNPQFHRIYGVYEVVETALKDFENALSSWTEGQKFPVLNYQDIIKGYLATADFTFIRDLEQIIVYRQYIITNPLEFENNALRANINRLKTILSCEEYKSALAQIWHLYENEYVATGTIDSRTATTIQSLNDVEPVAGLLTILKAYDRHFTRSDLPADEERLVRFGVMDRLVTMIPTLLASYDFYLRNTSALNPEQRIVFGGLMQLGAGGDDQRNFMTIYEGLRNPEQLKRQQDDGSVDSTLIKPINKIPQIIRQFGAGISTEIQELDRQRIEYAETKVESLTEHTNYILREVKKVIDELEANPRLNEHFMLLSGAIIPYDGLLNQIREMYSKNMILTTRLQSLRSLCSSEDYMVPVALLDNKLSMDYIFMIMLGSKDNQLLTVDVQALTISSSYYLYQQHLQAFAYALLIRTDSSLNNESMRDLIAELSSLTIESVPIDTNLDLFRNNLVSLDQTQFSTSLNKYMKNVTIDQLIIKPQVPLTQFLADILNNIPDIDSVIDDIIIPNIESVFGNLGIPYLAYYQQSAKTITDKYGIFALMYFTDQLNAQGDNSFLLPNNEAIRNTVAMAYSISCAAFDDYNEAAHQAFQRYFRFDALPRFTQTPEWISQHYTTLLNQINTTDFSSVFTVGA